MQSYNAPGFGFVASKLTLRSNVFSWHASLRSRLQPMRRGKKVNNGNYQTLYYPTNSFSHNVAIIISYCTSSRKMLIKYYYWMELELLSSNWYIMEHFTEKLIPSHFLFLRKLFCSTRKFRRGSFFCMFVKYLGGERVWLVVAKFRSQTNF